MDNNHIKDKYIGMMLDERYEILERVGAGGMALVYKARCHKLDRFVAVKILKDELAIDSEFRDRFQNESKAVAMLSHTNIVNVYDVSRSTNPDYIVMEYIEGLTLKEYMQSRGGALTWKESLHFVAQITKALIHAHSKGIIHRDIKPHNIMLLHDSSVKVTDFGIARLATKSNTLTKDTLGSVHYISPEQAKGSPVDKRTDIYSLGVVLYEMLTGRLPFEGENSVAIALQHFTSTPLSPREINPDIPKGLEAIVLRMMSPDLTRRYPSADALFEDLETFRRHPETEFDYEDLAASVTPIIDMSNPKENRSGDDTGGSLSARVNRVDKETEKRKYKESVKKARRNVVMMCVLLVLICAVGLVVFLWNYAGKDWFNPEPSLDVEVPDWTNISYEVIYGDAQYKDYFVFTRKLEPSDLVREGYVISQNPAAKSIKRMQTGEPIPVTLVVSNGAETISMPDLINKVDYRDAIVKLKGLGLNVEDITEEAFQLSATVTEGYIISTIPSEGTVLHPGDTVSMIVSKGPEIKYKTMPDLIDRSVEDAKIIIEGSNLTVGDVTAIANEKPYGTVLSQNIAANTDVKEHTKIDLMISDGTLAEDYVDPNATPTPTDGDSENLLSETDPPATQEPEQTPESTPTPTPSPTPEPTPSETPAPTPSSTPATAEPTPTESSGLIIG
ncbi:MAG: Stk1 family PASTA domain-containing Ser/Thr kinase [Oscillospiraceae bacterium]|jgi:serine/threonine-protein kinase|nr:Stk1 family PASTA domain-containing Ser/Thr kinase [Oscillospiraceae bacterium]